MNIISHTGIGARKENQDIILISELQNDMSLYLVVDGMGGYENGYEAAKIITEAIDTDANIIFGTTVNEDYTGELKITVVAKILILVILMKMRKWKEIKKIQQKN